MSTHSSPSGSGAHAGQSAAPSHGVRGLALDAAGFPYLDGELLVVPPRERAVLAVLLRQHPAVVSKENFARAVWRGGDMSDESLARCISRLRAPLARAGGAIEAVYGVGYRLVLPRSSPPSLLTATAVAAGATTDPGVPGASVTAAGVGAAVAAATAPPTVAQPPTAWANLYSPQVVETYAFCRGLLQQRTPEAISMAIDRLRALIAEAAGFRPARVALAEALAVAIGWGQRPTAAGVDEGLAVLAAIADDVPVTGRWAAQAALLDLAWRFDEADVLFRRAIAEDAHHADTLLAHARHLLYVDRADLAVERLREALRLAPHRTMLQMTLCRALAQAGQGDAALAQARAAVAAHPGELVMTAFGLAIQAMVAPEPVLAARAWRLTQGMETPPFVWTVLAYVLARVGHRTDALDVIEAALICSSTSPGEATLYAAPLAALGEFDQAAALLRAAARDRAGMLAMVLRDPAHAHWIRDHPAGRALLQEVFASLFSKQD